MNLILFIVVLVLLGTEAWKLRNEFFVIHLPFFKRKKIQKGKKSFKTFRYIKTKNGDRCIEEQRYRVI